MANENRIEAEVRLDSKGVQTGVGHASSELSKLDKAIDSSSAKIDGQMRRALSSLGGIAKDINFNTLTTQLQTIAGIDLFGNMASAGKAALSDIAKTGSGFYAEVAQVQTIADLDPSKLEAFSEKLRTIGAELKIGVQPIDAVRAAYGTLQNGFEDAAAAQDVLTSGLRLAEAGRAGQEKSLALLAGTLNSFSLSANNAERVSDKFFTTVLKGGSDLSIGTLADSLGRVSSLAHSSGVSMDEMLAALATMTSKGQQTGASVDGLAGIINAIQKPTEEAKKEFAALGIQVDATALKNKGLLKVVQDMNRALKERGNAGSLAQIAGDQSARTSLANLTGDGFAVFESNVTAHAESAGRQAKVLETTGKTSEAAYRRMTAAGEAFKVGLERDVEPMMAKAADTAAMFFGVLDKAHPMVKQLGLGAVILGTGIGVMVAGGVAAIGTFSGVSRILQGLGVTIPTLGRGTTQAAKDMALWRAETAAMQGAQTTLRATVAESFSTFAAGVGSISAFSLAVAGIGVAAVGAAVAYTDLISEVGKSDRDLAAAESGRGEVFGDRRKQVTELRTEDALNIDSQTLAEIGVKGSDVRFRAGVERNNLDKIVAGPGKDAALKQIQDLEAKAKELDELLAKQAKANSPEVQQQRLQSQKEIYKDELSAIETSRKGNKEKLADLEALRLKNYQLLKEDGDQRRSLDAKIAQARQALDRETAAKAKQAKAEEFKQDLQNVQQSKGDSASKIQQLNALAKKWKDYGDHRRAIEDQVRKHEEAIQKQREADVAKLAQLKEQAAQDEVSRSQERMSELEDLRGRGNDTFDAQVDELAKQGKSETDKIDADLEKDLAKESNPAVRAELKRQADARKKDVEGNFDRQGDQLLRADQQQRLSNEQQLVSQEKSLGDLRIQILNAQLNAGKNVQGQLRQAILERLALEEREIRIQADLAKAQTDDPRAAAQAERQAQAEILRARKAATDEINRATEAMREQKKAKNDLWSGEMSGRMQGIDEFLADNHGFFGDKEKQKKMDIPVPGIDVARAEQLVLDQKRLKPTDLKGSSNTADTVKVAGEWKIVLLNDKGEVVPHRVKEVTIDGRGSNLSKASRAMSGSNGLGGF